MPIPGTWDDPKKKLTDDPGALPQAGTSNPAIVISGVTATLYLSIGPSRQYQVQWTTNVPSSSRVQYGSVSILDRGTAEKDTNPLVTSHDVIVGAYLVGTAVFFRVHSRIMGGRDGMNNAVMDGYDFYQDGSFVAA